MGGLDLRAAVRCQVGLWSEGPKVCSQGFFAMKKIRGKKQKRRGFCLNMGLVQCLMMLHGPGISIHFWCNFL